MCAAVVVGNRESLEVLLAHEGVDLEARTTKDQSLRFRGMTPLLMCVAADNLESLNMVIAAGADVNATVLDFGSEELRGKSAVEMARLQGKPHLVEVLEAAGASA